ncbi:MAG: D-alanyl-D-alanine carboxypeptidase/D-alanyl-D-alanine-endopeptidase, partial [Odoribacter sp.]|nr:D-alanyl-D-alanine carboxypeptidase/D-alanyl-D-alanine-endopeptidase [Odoribacter sp.]
GHIIVAAQGDPTLDSRYFPGHSLIQALVVAMKEKGIRRIQGKIIVEGAQRGVRIPGSWPWEDISNYYGALYLPFNYRDNMFTLQLSSGMAGRPVKLLSVTPALPGVEIRNEVIAGTDRRDDAWIFGGPYSSVLCVRGTIPANRPVFRVKGAMHDPAGSFLAELESVLLKDNVRLDHQEMPVENKLELIGIDSPVLRDIVWHTNKSSINLFAEALGALVAPDNWTGKIGEALKQIGIDVSGMVLKDACGLSPLNAVPAQVFTDLLVDVGRHRETALVNSLPEAGVDGGLAGYCRFSPELKGKLKAKTGSMSGVRCLSGMITRNNGEQLAFTILINHYTCTVAELQKAVGEFLSGLL